MSKMEEVFKKVERFKKEMEELGVDVKVTVSIDLRRRL